MNIVWFKRDLRIFDHSPLRNAISRGNTCALYVLEREYWKLPDTSLRHWDFTRDCLRELDEQLRGINLKLIVRSGNALTILREMHSNHGIDGLFSHEETGNLWQRQRDKKIRAWCNETGILWHENQQFGVIRGLKSRNGWSKKWSSFMAQPLLNPPRKLHVVQPLSTNPSSKKIFYRRTAHSSAERQQGGRSNGVKVLESFLKNRSMGYQKNLSSPLTAYDNCSRISPYIAYGCLSMREVVQATRGRMEELKSEDVVVNKSWISSLRSFYARLHWHCHFIQKLEDEPLFEIQNVHSTYDGMRDEEKMDIDCYNAWATGKTGFPFVDACMRALIELGWINFRMRAMLQAFASYHLWLHWRFSGLHLARLFTDYEPGIHWNQAQMQSGTTGINTLRIYNPVKQSMDHDPQGHFIRRWVPELSLINGNFIHEPWKMTPAQQETQNCIIGVQYPEPIINHIEAAKNARARVYGRRKTKEFVIESRLIQTKHGSRKSGITRVKKRNVKSQKKEAQLALDL